VIPIIPGFTPPTALAFSDIFWGQLSNSLVNPG
jgi:hypothetical protein